jgi:hypothetical protein
MATTAIMTNPTTTIAVTIAATTATLVLGQAPDMIGGGQSVARAVGGVFCTIGHGWCKTA